jgi:ATP-binding cassette subfamily C protein
MEAARAAGAHEMILRLPQGYDTPLGEAHGVSGGQAQRIGLARALFGDPVLLVLDEPDAHLDAEGSVALSRAIRAARAGGKAVLVMAHRPAAIQDCDRLLALEAGRVRALGPRDEVLREVLRTPGPAAADLRRDTAR